MKDYPTCRNRPVVIEAGGAAYWIREIWHKTNKGFSVTAANKSMERLLKSGEVVIGKWDEFDKDSGEHTRTYYVREAECFWRESQ